MGKDFYVEFRTGFWWLLLIIVTFLTLGPLAVVFRVISFTSGCVFELLLEGIRMTAFRTVKQN